MSTALISDLHLGSVGGEDILRDPAARTALWERLQGCARVILLGDTVELRDLPLDRALEAARPFFEELGEAVGGAEVVLVPGNHDHRFAEALLDGVRLGHGGGLGLEQLADPADEGLRRIDRWVGASPLRVAYPGIWLREDVYAMHGHYLDCHLTLPRAESIGANLLMRLSERPPDPARPADYERALRPMYGLIYGLAQSENGVAGGASRISEGAWEYMRSSGGGGGSALTRRIARGAVPGVVWALNRALGSSFDPDLSPGAITRSAVAAAAETARRLEIDAEHVICGHTHRAGPRPDDDPWLLAGGGRLHNTGNWVFTRALHRPAKGPGPYWPGTLTWLDDEGPPRQERLLEHWSHADLAAVADRNRISA